MRSILKMYGGKAYLAKRIVAMMPYHTHYIEPFFGSGAVLFEKNPEGISESVNDINSNLINFWRVLQKKTAFEEFKRLCEATPFSETEFNDAKSYIDETTYKTARCLHAWKYFITNRQSRQAMNKNYATPTKRTRRGMNEHVAAWLTAVDKLTDIHSRLRRVELRSIDFESFIKTYDHKDMVCYADPPYLEETRSLKNAYDFEMSINDHKRLLKILAKIKGKFILSGYPSSLYNQFAGKYNWEYTVIEIDNKASSSKTKEIKHECLWYNY